MSIINEIPGDSPAHGESGAPGGWEGDVVRRFEAQAARTPGVTAVEMDGAALTYAELDRAAERLADRLAALGVVPETRVGIFLERSPETVTALLAVLKAGGAFVPMDPAYPAERLAYLAGDSGVGVLVTRTLLRGRAPQGPALVCVDEAGGSASTTGQPRIAVAPENAAYVIYTSGSTGAPKGVVVPRAALANHVAATVAEYSLKPGDRVLQFASPAFDVAVEEVLPTLASGATLVIRAERAMDSLSAFLTFARDARLTVWNLPSPYWHELVGEVERSGAPVPETLRLLVVGSEATSPAALRGWSRAAGERVAFRNAYGPTEATVTATVYAPPPDGPPPDAATVPVGRPLANVRAYVTGPDGALAGEGEAGELCLGGAGVARGYLGRAAATAERFVPDPFSPLAGARMYRTGDRARWRGGALEFLGRVDRQVKVRGFRVEPEEIEAALRAHPAVREAAVVLREDAPGGARLVGYAAGDPGALSADALRAHLAARLPAYMVPGALVVLPTLPTTPGGKVDRRALPAPSAAPRDAGEPPRPGVESRIAAVWEEVLRVDGIGRSESFLALGGNSLLAAQVVSRLRQAIGVELSIPALLVASTVAGLAEAAERARAETRVPPPRPLPGPRGGDHPLSLSQERAWFMSRLRPDSLAYQFQAAFRFRGALDEEVLERSLEEMVRRHEIFRTSFPEIDGRPVQRVHPPIRVRVPREELRDVPPHQRRDEADRRIRAELERRFDLAEAPLVRWRLLRLGDDVWELVHVEHHIVHDGWSFNVFLAELLEVYRAFAAGRPSPLADPALQFADYAAWQREWLDGPEAAAQLDYWKRRLDGAPPLLELPTDRPRPPVQRFRGALRRMEMPPAEVDRLRAFGRAHDATLFMTMVSAFAALMGRYAGQDEVCVGSAVANRRWREAEGTIGMFVNSVVLRLEMENDPTFAALVACARRTTLEAYARQDLPFDRVVQALAPERSLSHNPLHQVLFSFDDARMPETEVPGLAVTVREGLSNGSAKFDMNIIVAPRTEGSAGFSDGWEAGGLTVLWEFDADLFDPATVERMLEQYRRLLLAAAEAPELRVSALPLLDDAGRSLVIDRWNDTVADVPADACIHELVSAQARRTPDAPAVAGDDGALTYAALEHRAEAIAARLRALGVAPESRVGVCVERGAGMVAAVLGVLKTGAAYVPLDPSHPAERLEYVAADAGIGVVVTQPHLRERIPAASAHLVFLDETGAADRRASTEPAPPTTSPEAAQARPGPASIEARHGPELPVVAQTYGQAGFPRPIDSAAPTESSEPAAPADLAEPAGSAGVGTESLAYVLYTSGSTGRPKGVMVTHRALANFIADMRGRVGMAPGETLVAVTTLAFDIAGLEIFLPLVCGARVVVAGGETVADGARLRDLLESSGATVFQATPATFQLLLDAGWPGAPGMRVLCGGEAVPGELAAALAERAVRAWNVYGPTETTIWSTAHPLEAGAPVLIGAPLANTRCYVLDGQGAPLPPGVPGELWIGGAGVARGYLGRPALTAERFAPDPFAAAPGARMYRTGDRARWRDGGVLEFLGRADHQVKVRGFRIEPGEIEEALRAHPAVREAVAVVREDRPGDRRLIAYAAGDALPAESELRALLRGRLPDYMVPAAIVALDALPRTPNGKVDRRALPAPEHRAGAQTKYVPPRSPAEEAVAELWAEVLGVGRVGVHDDFFALGGHSLVAARAAGRLPARLGRELPLRVLFERPTPAGIAAYLEGRAGPAVPPPAPRATRPEPVPASPGQERLWALEAVNPGTAAYNLPAAVRLRGALDAGALERALTALVARHEALRTTFGAGPDGAPVQVIAHPAPVALERTEPHGMPDGGRAAFRRRIRVEEASRPMDLVRGPLFRARLVRVAADDHDLLLTLHHAISDGWSLGLVLRELAALYGAFAAGEEPRLAPPAVQFADYALWLRDELAGGALEAQLAYWRSRLAGAPAAPALPADHPRPALPSARGGEHRFVVAPGVAAGLRALARSEGATPFMVLLAAYQLLLSRSSGEADVVVGTASANRMREEVEGTVGFFVNTIPLRAELGDDPPFRTLLRRTRESTLDAYAHQDVPLEKVVEALGLAREPGRDPLVRAVFVMDNAGGDPPAFAGLETEVEYVTRGTAKFDLLLSFAEDGDGGLVGHLDYRAELFEPATVARMAGHLANLLASVAADPDARASALALMDGAERRRVVVEWNQTAAGYPRGAPIHRLFEEQAARTPEAPAVLSGDDTTSYRALDERANRLARRLVRMGVGRESRVGICLERGPDMVAAILAALKAGGAYVPLDPGYPAERLAFILADAGVSVLVTEDRLRAALPLDARLRVLCVDGDRAEVEAEGAAPLGHVGDARGLAYVMYTSGSTGTPKGVAVEHRGVVRLVRGADYADFGTGEVVLQAAPVSFDASTLEIWGALLNGGRLALLPGGTPSLETLGRAIGRHGVTTLWLTAGLFAAMVEERIDDLAGVRQLLAGGDVLPVDAVAKVRARFPGLRLINGYGPTENTTFTCCHTVDARWRGGPVPIGSPISNTRVYVLDGALRPVPTGVPGELYAAGDGVARGYLGRAAATAERFVPDPFAAEPGARMYRTGDRARWRSDGVVEYLGRLDAQVKVRGFRVEPGEVEAALATHPGVRACAVAAREDAAGDRRLIAYVVGAADAGALKAHLRRSLPEHMVPGVFVSLDHLPLTPNGKVDRAALPAPEHAPADDRRAAPRTPVEEVLAAIWAEVLATDRVGVDEDFFALGGHSLSAARVVARVRAVFGVELAVRALFEAPTVEALAAAVEAARAGGARVEDGEIPVVDRGGPLPLSFQQRQLWLLDRMNPGLPLYNVPAAWRLTGALDADALAAALAGVVRRHETLRTVLRMVGGEPVQAVLPDVAVDLPLDDLSALPAEARDREARARMRRSAETRFDLERGPLFRAELVRLAADEHLLLLCLHHAVADGWSLGVLFREMAALYAAGGADGALPHLPAQYADYAAWQRETLSGERLERQTAWWRAHLSGAPALLNLPADRPRPAVQSYRGGLHRFALPERLAAAVEALARREGASPYMVLLAAWQVLLARYAGQDEVVVGSPIANRTRPELEGVVGFFANTLALRTTLGGDPAFREVVARVRETTLDAYAHQEVPFETLVEALQPERSLGHNPVFQAFFALQNTAGEALSLAGMAVEAVPEERHTAKFDLSLFLVRGRQGMEATLEYAADLFDAATAERMAAHLAVLLEAAVADPGRRVSELPLATAAERETVVRRWSGAGARLDVTDSLHGRFEARAAARPAAIAVTHQGETLTYGELNARANRLARRLRALGVVPESRVGLCAERSPDLVAGVLAIVKAGAAYVPLDPAYPAERLAYMAEDSGIRVLLAAPSLLDRVPGGIEVLSLHDAAADELPDDPGIAVSPHNLAYVIYTSGSTGKPKGVGVTHGNVLRLFDCTRDSFAFGEADTWTLFHSFAFDFSVWEMWGALLYGGRLVVVPWAVSRDPAAFRELLRREGVTVLNQTPSAFRALARADEEAPEPLDALRLVVFGGEALRYESLRGWLDRYGPRRPRLVNMYGITETTVHVTWHTVTGQELRRAGAGSGVGVPIPDLRAYLLDPAGNPAPVGVPGELHVGGAGLARGYLGRPGLTSARFVPDPFSGEPGARLYRSGDLARWKADGTLEYLGRIDQQVKVRGFRIELGEVESVLLAQPGVAAAAVVVRGEGEDAALAAYVVPAGDPPSIASLREALKTRLPEHMVPPSIVAIDRIPLTANGKLDRAALPASAAGAGAGDFVAPRTPTEEVLAGIWREVLGVGRVGARDDFFELGGHSLRATQVAARIGEVFGVGVPLRTLFEAATVEALAREVETLRHAGLPALPPIVPAERGPAIPLSFGQERLWFLDRLEPGGSAYNQPVALRLSGALDARALERALGGVVGRHEALRTTFAEVDGAPAQVIAPFADFHLPVEELSALAEDEREAAARRRAAEEAARPFDLAAGPLFRARLLRLAADEHVLLLCIHHVASDGWSLGVLFRELSALYAAHRDGRDPGLPDLPVQYADFAAWQREQLRGPALDRQLAWWRERLSGVPALLELPTDRPRPPVQSTRGARVPVDLPAGLAERLAALGRREGATTFMVLLAAFQVLLGRYAGSDDVVVGTPIAGRTRRETEGVIGFFANTLVLRADLSGDPSFREVLRRVRGMTLGAYEHQDAPFERLVEELRPQRSLSHSPLVQAMFVMEDAGAPREALPGVRTAWMETALGSTKFDVTLALGADDGGLTGVLDYAADLFDRATMERMAAHLHRLLEEIAADAGRPISALDLMGDVERRTIVEEWSRTEDALPAGRPVHERVAEQAARTPDAPAVAFGSASISYGELEARANRLARHLARLGVGPERRVGICLDRGADMVCAVLAVLKAGGAYVPLDPAYPAERLAFMAADSGSSVLLTRERLRAAIPAAGGVRVVALDTAAAEIAAESADPLPPRAEPENLAYLIYTSGSTGRPKGVAVHHAALSSYLAWAARAYPAGRSAVHSPLSFDLTVTSLFVPLLGGGCVELVEDEAGVEGLAARLERGGGYAMLKLTPAHLRLLAERLDGKETAGGAACLVVGGEALTGEHLAYWARRFPSTVVVNEYGPTETVVGCAIHTTRAEQAAPGRLPVGRAAAGTRLYVLDAGGRPVPAGVPGELYVGGAQVARGYLDRPGLTAERFVPDPFAARPGARMYRTGDRARWLADGTLDCLGRVDAQVKVRGFRVEPGEVEAALRRHPGVAECAVLARAGTDGEARLVAYVAGAAGADELRAFLRSGLPEHLVPSAFVAVGAIPLTPNGKVDARALPAPEPAAGPAFVAPRDELERGVAEVWARVLGIPAVGVRDNFFDVGGTSLLLYRVYAGLREMRGDLRVVDLFRHATVESLARRLAEPPEGGADVLEGSRSRAAERRAARGRGRGGSSAPAATLGGGGTDGD